MGNSAAVQQHVDHWEAAVKDLTALCDTLQAESQQPSQPVRGAQEAHLRRSSSERLHITAPGDPQDDGECGASVRLPDGSGPTDSLSTQIHKIPRHVAIETRRQRTALFKSFADPPEPMDLACGHFATVAVALTVLLGGSYGTLDRKKAVTVEDLFFAAQIPLHMAHRGRIFLTELYDIVREFLNVDNRFKGQYNIEAVHFDVAPVVGTVDIGSNDVGDRQPRVTPSEFRKAVTHELEEGSDAVRVVSYDAYVAEQEMLVDDNDDDSTEDVLSLSTYKSKSISSVTNLNDSRKGHTTAFACIVDYRNPVEYLLTTAHGSVGKRLTVQVEELPLPALYKAMAYVHNAGRARGYLRIWKRDPGERSCQDDEGTFISEELCSGKVLGSLSQGTSANTTSELISPYIVATAWALHLIQGALPDKHNHGCGLPVSGIIRGLRLCSEEYLKCDMSLDQAYLRVREYLSATPALGDVYGVSLHPVLTNVSRQSAVPSLSMSELETFLGNLFEANDNREAPNVMMVVQYNPDIAHNVIGISKSAQWAVVVGYSDTSIRLIDGNALKFCSGWYCPLVQFHRAMTNHGYMLIYRRESHAGFADELPVVAAQRVRIVERQRRATPKIQVLYPPYPMTVSTLALALRRVGVDGATLDDMVQHSAFDVSALIGTLPLEACGIVLREYLSKRGIDDVSVAIHPMEVIPNSGVSLSDIKLGSLLAMGNDPTCSVVVFFSKEVISVHGVMHPFDDSAVVEAHDATGVVMTDANPIAYRRSWTVSLSSLYVAVSKNIVHRNHGVIVISRGEGGTRRGGSTPPAVSSMSFRLESAPLQQPFAVSPSAHMQALSIAFAQLGYSFSPEELFYEAYLKTMTNQRRRGSQAFAWRDVDVSLAILNRKMDARVMHQVASSFLTHRRISDVQATLTTVDPGASFAQSLEAAVASPIDPCQQVLLVCYDTKALFGTLAADAAPLSVGLVRWYDADAGQVGCMDAEYVMFGPEWSSTVDALAQAANTGAGIPLVRLSVGRGESMAAGRGFRGFSDSRSFETRESRGSGSRASVTFDV